MKKVFCVIFFVSIKNLKNLKYHTFSKKHYFFLLFVVSARMQMKIFKEEESIEILKNVGLIENN